LQTAWTGRDGNGLGDHATAIAEDVRSAGSRRGQVA
jgi:hypothetical protein